MKWLAIAAVVGLAVVGGLAFALWAGRGTTAAGTCNTTLLTEASAWDDFILVVDISGCDHGDSILIGTLPSRDCEVISWVQPEDQYLGFGEGLLHGHEEGEPVVEVSYCPYTEDCDDGIDNDLDGMTDCEDADCDGDPACQETPTPSPTATPPATQTSTPTPTPTPGIQCCSYGGDAGCGYPPPLVPNISLDPDSGRPDSSFEIELNNADWPTTGQSVEVIWDLDFHGGGELLGSVTMPTGDTSVSIQATVPADATPGPHAVTRCEWDSSAETWILGMNEFWVVPPMVEPTPPAGLELKPGPQQIWNCPQAGKWSIAMWAGDYDTDIDEALATCGEGAVAAAYHLDRGSQGWSRWFPGRPEISNLVALNTWQGLVLLGSPAADPASIEAHASSEAAGQMRGCPLPNRWSLAVWDGPDGTDIEEALATCVGWDDAVVDVVYAFHPETGEILHYISGHPEISTLEKVDSGWGLMPKGGGSWGCPDCSWIAFSWAGWVDLIHYGGPGPRGGGGGGARVLATCLVAQQ
jgi:hypothetical protein